MLRFDYTSDLRRIKEFMLDDERHFISKRVDGVVGAAIFAGCLYGMMVIAGVMS